MATLDGETVRLADLRGRVVVVSVWATWCLPCRVETPGFVGLQSEFEGEGRSEERRVGREGNCERLEQPENGKTREREEPWNCNREAKTDEDYGNYNDSST